MQSKKSIGLLFMVVLATVTLADDHGALPDTKPLTLQGDLSAQMVAGIDKFLMREIEHSIVERQKFWQRDFTSREAYENSIATNRQHLRKILGAVDQRLPVTALEFVSDSSTPALVAETKLYSVHAVRWPVFEGVYGEGLWLKPKGGAVARVVALPDADQTPEMLVGLSPGLKPQQQFARTLAENGCEVLVPVLINRDDTWSGNPQIKRFTNQPHREWLYRQAYEMGRHIIGYEVQKVLAAVDWFSTQPRSSRREEAQTSKVEKKSLLTSAATGIGVAGYGEGGLIAFYSAALDPRIDAALVSGYFDSRQRVWEEPIYRNVFGLLAEFGDAEIATLIAPRSLLIEHSTGPLVDGPPKSRSGRSGAAPGKLKPHELESVEAEFERARALLAAGKSAGFDSLKLFSGNEGTATGPGSERALVGLLNALGVPVKDLAISSEPLADARTGFDASERQHRQVAQLEGFTQKLLRDSERVRAEFFWNKTKNLSTNEWAATSKEFKNIFWEEVIGKFPAASLPANPRSRRIEFKSSSQVSTNLLTRPSATLSPPAATGRQRGESDGERDGVRGWKGYEVVLDVCPDVYAWGYLLLPKDLKPGERRPVVVCQHGLEGVPEDTLSEDPKGSGYPYYKAFSARLAERGFVVFAPHNPYRGQDKFRVLQRKANPLKKSLFSVILAQHDRILDWLSAQPFVDPQRIGFYGLSYGGKTAMRVPSLLDRYCLSICSADFNEWIWKNATVDSPYSYMFGGEYEMVEFNLGHTFNYAEMAALVAPRPFMVERGHNDGVAPDEQVAYEYAKVRRVYDQLGLGDRTALEVFNGPHTINGVGTYKFLHQHLNWPGPPGE